MISKKEFNYYLNQGVRTKVKKGSFDSFPNDIEKLCRIIHGLLVHPATVKRLHNLDLSKKRLNEKNLKTVTQVLNKAKILDHAPLIFSRKPDKRVVAICKHFSMLLCSILREKGIPARTRCGFATYFVSGWFEDHWICEYWSKSKKRWIRVDPQIDDLQAVAYHIDREKIKFVDLPRDVFFPAGVLWKLYRDGFIDGKMEGFSLEPGECGEWYLRGNLLRDFFALNEIEYLYSEEDLLMKRTHELSEEEFALLDEIALCTSKPDINFEHLRTLFLENLKNKKLIPKRTKLKH